MPTASTKKTDVDTSPEALNAQIEQLRKDISGITELLTQRGTKDVIQIQDRAKSAAQNVTARTQEAIESLNDQAGQAEAKLMLEIRKKPLAAVGIAAGVGFLAALLTRSK